MSAIFNDGQIPFGGRLLRLTGSNGTPLGVYVAEDFAIDAPSQTIKRYTEMGEPNGQVVIADFKNGTATLQLQTTNSTVPQVYDTFTFSTGSVGWEAVSGSESTACITSVSRPEAQTAYKKCSIAFTVKYN